MVERIALPQMQAAGYAPALSSGNVAAGGTLGALIPPSAPIILFALMTEASIGLYSGVFTATESAAVGAIGAFLMALWRRKLTRNRVLEVMGETTAVTAMIYLLIFGALDVAPLAIIALLLIVYLLLGSPCATASPSAVSTIMRTACASPSPTARSATTPS